MIRFRMGRPMPLTVGTPHTGRRRDGTVQEPIVRQEAPAQLTTFTTCQLRLRSWAKYRPSVREVIKQTRQAVEHVVVVRRIDRRCRPGMQRWRGRGRREGSPPAMPPAIREPTLREAPLVVGVSPRRGISRRTGHPGGQRGARRRCTEALRNPKRPGNVTIEPTARLSKRATATRKYARSTPTVGHLDSSNLKNRS